MKSMGQMIAEMARFLPLSRGALAELSLMGPLMTNHVDVMLAHHPELRQNPLPLGSHTRRLLQARSLAELLDTLAGGDPRKTLVVFVQLLARRHESGFTPQHWRLSLECWRLMIDSHLSPETAHEVRPLLLWLANSLDDLIRTACGEAA
ncbi:hypothetical protein JXA47_13600 [Candidatus Sumerlaeota bacterium]|nr:hypothetical protein [Candidatus Sumerlaeota bacterium]